LIKINSKLIAAEAYNSDLQIIGLDLLYDDISINNDIISETAILYQNCPNPFDEKTIIGFEVPKEGACFLTIY